MSVVDKLFSAEEYRQLPDNGQPNELVRGRIVILNVPTPRHGEICNRIGRLLGDFVEQNRLGRVVSNDSAVVTQRGPDTVRGADLAFYSFDRVPKGPLPAGYLQVVPELIFEVRSTSDRWASVLEKVAEYLHAGVAVVCVLDPGAQTLHLYRGDQPVEVLSADRNLTLPDLLPGLEVIVSEFFH